MTPFLSFTRPMAVRHRRILTTLGSLGLATLAYVLSFALRFDLRIPPHWIGVLASTLPIMLGAKLIGFHAFGLFSGWWRHVSLRDVEDIAYGNLLGSALLLAGLFFLRGLQGFPRAVLVLDLFLCTTLMAGFRVAVRLLRERAEAPGPRRVDTLALIVGAGTAGIGLLQEMERRRRLRVAVVGFVDDDESKRGLRVCGTPVLGDVDEIPRLVSEHDVGEVLIAIPSAGGARLRRIVERCQEAHVRHRVLPSLGELVEGRVMYTQMREIEVDDLLARAPVRLDLPKVRSLVAGRTVLVTGAAGSIGSELCRQLAHHRPERVVLYDRHENGVYLLEKELRERFARVSFTPVLGDVTADDQLRLVFAAHRPELVFHAAAYKHVPLVEANVLEAVRNNVFGTYNVARAAMTHGAKEFVLVSTDKAVRPSSVMGLTKRAAEMVIQQLQNGGCRFVAVRFGNVLGSSGSVVPLFREQIARGGPVTVTDPEVTRYFMTIPEASQLILQAAALGQGGEVFVLDMGEPMKIVDLARHMIRLSGFEPDEDIPIVFTGLRPGEKLEEQLVAEDEAVATTYHDRIRVLRRERKPQAPEGWLIVLDGHLEAGDMSATLRLLRQLVPGYQPSALWAAELRDRGKKRSGAISGVA